MQMVFRQNSGTEDLYWTLAARVERAILAEEVSFDFKKCFGLIPHGILFNVQEIGLGSQVLGPIRSMYSSLQRRWKLGKDVVGSTWQTSNGILQGCGVSVVLDTLVTFWLYAMSAEVPASAEPRPGGVC